MSSDDRLMYLKANEVHFFKIMFDILKEILPDTNIEFYKNAREKGFRIKDISPEKSIMFLLKIDANKLSEFYCSSQNSYVIGVNLVQLCSLLKSTEDSDEFVMCVNKDESQLLRLITRNHIKHNMSEYTLGLSDLNFKQFEIPESDFDVLITINTDDFHKMCKDMKRIGEELDIRCTDKSIEFSCKDPKTSLARNTKYNIDNRSDNGVKINYVTSNKNAIIHGVYELNHLILFTKCSGFSPKLILLMKIAKFPLGLRYTIGEIGALTALITTVQDNRTSMSDTSSEINY